MMTNHVTETFKNKFAALTFILVLIMSFITTKTIKADDTKSIEQKVNEILTQLTLDEKLSLLHGNSKFTIAGIERLGIPEWKMSDGPHGVREEVNRDNWEPAGWENDYATYLPTGTALAATWNPELAYEFGVVLGKEARARDKDIILGPGINIHRTPLCGRNFEYMSEDPYLITQMVVPYIKGVQEQDVAACVKHYALNNQEHERFNVNAIVDERTLREIYLPGFEAAIIEGKAITVMSAYNKFRGKWCGENKYLLTDILKNEWGFDGVVISDWNGTHSTIDAALAGLDIEMGTDQDNYNDFYFADPLKKAVENGDVDVSVIDDKVSRILRSMIKTKVFDDDRSKGEFITEANFAVAKKVAEEAIVLLKNENDVLPLNKNEIKSIAVIGENATTKHALGGGSSGIKAKYEITPLEGLQNKLGDDIKLNYAPGYKATTVFDWGKGVSDTGNTDVLKTLREEAVRVAESSELVIMFLGLNHHLDAEAFDRPDMKLPFEQDELIKQVLAVNKNVVVLMIGGSPVEMNEWIDDVPAIVQGWYAGSEAGNVFADVLFGDVNPSGKLTFTFPKKLADSPAHSIGDYPGVDLNVEHKEGIFVGYRYFDSKNVRPQFAFGHGLSYTTFEYSDITVDNNELNRDGKIDVSFNVANTGSVSGKEVAQLYVQDVECSVERPSKELKLYKKVNLLPGETKKINFEIDESMLTFYDVETMSWKAEPGKFIVHVGSASDDVRLTSEFQLVENK